LGAFQQISQTFRLLGHVFLIFFIYIFFFRSPGKKISAGNSAKTVKDRKMSKIDLDSYDTEAAQDHEFSNVAPAICSQEHLPSYFCSGNYAKPYKIKKFKKYFWIRVLIGRCHIMYSMT